MDLGLRGLREIEIIGSGGSAIVYKAVRQVPGRFAMEETVAVKLLRSSWDTTARRRFAREQRVMGRLSDTAGFVPILETGETVGGSPYIIMPYYRGGSLQQRISRSGPIEWPRAVRLIEQVALTLAEAHELDIFHRDIKPANILLTEAGRPHVADFGIALIADDTAARATSTAAFTPAYSPPESFTDGLRPLVTTDVYSLAATLWAIVAGHAPFKDLGEQPAPVTVFGRVSTQQVGDLRDRVPSPICRFIEEAMAKRPENRPQTMAVFLSQLQAAREDAYRGVEAERLEARPLLDLTTTSERRSRNGADGDSGWDPALVTIQPGQLTGPLHAPISVEAADDELADSELADEVVADDEVADDEVAHDEVAIEPIADESDEAGTGPETEADDEEGVIQLGVLPGEDWDAPWPAPTDHVEAPAYADRRVLATVGAGEPQEVAEDWAASTSRLPAAEAELEPELIEERGSAFGWVVRVFLAAVLTAALLFAGWWLLRPADQLTAIVPGSSVGLADVVTTPGQ